MVESWVELLIKEKQDRLGTEVSTESDYKLLLKLVSKLVLLLAYHALSASSKGTNHLELFLCISES